MLAIQTKFHGPTNTRGSRVSATVCEPKPRRVTIDWDHALDSQANHETAARELIRKLDWTAGKGYGDWVSGSTETGYVFVCNTRHGDARLEVW